MQNEDIDGHEARKEGASIKKQIIIKEALEKETSENIAYGNAYIFAYQV